MVVQFRRLPLMLLGQVPTVLTLALLGGLAWWGYVWDWKIPTLPGLLNPATAKKGEEEAKKSEDDDKATEGSDKALPPIKLRTAEAMEEAGIKTKPVVEQEIGEYVKAHGHVDYNKNHYAHLSTRASGSAWRVFKREGDEVKRGDVLALIASPELAQLKFDLQQTLLMVKSRERYYQRLKSAESSTPPKDVESSHFALRESRVALSKTQQSLQNLGLHVPLDELVQLNVSDEQVATRLRTLGIPDSLLQGLDANSVTGNNLLPMYAPFDGMVVNRDIVMGEMVTPATPQFHLADLRHLWICLHARMEDVGRLKEGQEVAFHLDGPNEDAPPARIAWVSAEVDEKTRTVPVRAEVENLRGRLRPNSYGDARILVGRQNRLTVPNESLQYDGTSHVVFVQGDSPTEFQPRRVQLGPRHEDSTIVLSGIKEGEVVAVSGSHVLLSEMLKERIAGED
ncbi:MAG TPA: efflux RND transporter periplasmic adaptor subunit [Gemmataceae bacterium]